MSRNKVLPHDCGTEEMWKFWASSERYGRMVFDGFCPVILEKGNDGSVLGKAWMVVLAKYYNEFSLWMLRDEAAYKEMLSYFQMYAGVIPDCHFLKPHSLWSGDWEVDRYMKEGS